MEKLLHERLKELTDDDFKFICADGFEAYLTRKSAEHIADEIEKYYIPHPLFENGEPVNNDELGDNAHVNVSLGGCWELIVNDEVVQCGDYWVPVTHPRKKIVDADGVEINVGDTVYLPPSITPHKVLIVKPNYVLTTDCHGYPHPELLTHNEPDTLEKVIESMVAYSGEYVRPGTIEDQKTDEWISRLNAIMERDA